MTAGSENGTDRGDDAGGNAVPAPSSAAPTADLSSTAPADSAATAAPSGAGERGAETDADPPEGEIALVTITGEQPARRPWFRRIRVDAAIWAAVWAAVIAGVFGLLTTLIQSAGSDDKRTVVLPTGYGLSPTGSISPSGSTGDAGGKAANGSSPLHGASADGRTGGNGGKGGNGGNGEGQHTSARSTVNGTGSGGGLAAGGQNGSPAEAGAFRYTYTLAQGHAINLGSHAADHDDTTGSWSSQNFSWGGKDTEGGDSWGINGGEANVTVLSASAPDTHQACKDSPRNNADPSTDGLNPGDRFCVFPGGFDALITIVRNTARVGSTDGTLTIDVRVWP